MSYFIECRVQFYETDLMGIVHHSNYLRYFEEARVAWAISNHILDYQDPRSGYNLAVLTANIKYQKPLKFGDHFKTYTRARLEGARICFEYLIKMDDLLMCSGRTEHVALDVDLKPIKTPLKICEILKKNGEVEWKEIWP